MNLDLSINNLWVFYALAYVIAYSMQVWSYKKRGAPVDDPEFLIHGKHGKKLVAIAATWIASGFVISLFVRVNSGILLYAGILVSIVGLILGGFAAYSYANKSGLVTKGFLKYSRNPMYVVWTIILLGLTIIGWSGSIWSILFAIYLIVTLFYFYWTTTLEEEFLTEKYGDSYRKYLKKTPRYLGLPRR
ncbi:MAG: methyltransferase family protein [Desulfobaccales bacterium]